MATRAGDEGERHEASKEQEDGTSSSSSCLPKGYQFNFLNWFYWNLWWQQYSYNWAMYHQQGMMGYPPGTNVPSPAPGSGETATSNSDARTGTRPNQETGANTNANVHQQQPQQQYAAWGQPPFNQQWNWNVPQFANPFQFPSTSIGQVYLRTVAGYETHIAPFWRRCAAELIDTVLFSMLLKFYQPDIDLRIPEIVFKGSSVWDEMDEGDLLDVKDMLTWFLLSSIMERLFHAVLETAFLVLFSCTPGKWLMGLRVWSCNTAHLTRTAPGYSIRVHPGGRLSPILLLFRSIFKATVSLFIPMVIFFFNLRNGRTKYDEFFGSVVVDTYSLKRPIYTTTSGVGGVNFNQNNDLGNGNGRPAVNRPQFRVG